MPTLPLPADLAARYAPSGEVGNPSPSRVPLFVGPRPWYRDYLPACNSERTARRLLSPLMPALLAAGLIEPGGYKVATYTTRPDELARRVRALLADATGTQRKTPRVRAVLADVPWTETFVCMDCHHRKPVAGRVRYRCADCAARAVARAAAKVSA